MHQIRFPLGSAPDPLAGFEGATSKGREGKGERMRGEGREEKVGMGGEGRGEEAFLVMWPRRLSALNPPLYTRFS